MHAESAEKPAEGGPIAEATERLLSVRETFAGKHIFVTGVTGFVGKVLLAMIATELRAVRRVTVLVRTNRQYSDARERFDATVALSEPFQEVARRIGNDPLQDWCDDVVDVVAGDITLDRLAVNVTTLMFPLFLIATMTARSHKPYVEMGYGEVLKLSAAYQGGIVAWVAFWVFYGQGFGAMSDVATFAAAYAVVLLIEPIADLAVLAAAKALHKHKDSGLFVNRLHHAA